MNSAKLQISRSTHIVSVVFAVFYTCNKKSESKINGTIWFK